jgi:hypothetical protein
MVPTCYAGATRDKILHGILFIGILYNAPPTNQYTK